VQVTVAEAARLLGVPEKTVRRKIRTGELSGAQANTAQGVRWMVEIPDGTPDQEHREHHNEDCAALREVILVLREELEARRRETQEFLFLLQQLQRSLPAPGPSRPWWKWWGSR
jgi:predicted DNA-binding transcriptional regulator YafY